MAEPQLVQLSEELQAIQQRWLAASRPEQDIIYATEFGPRFAPLFAQLPLDGWQGPRPSFKALISILGFSWQPVALMAAWLKPAAVLLLGTPDSCSLRVQDKPVKQVIAEISGLPEAIVQMRQVDDPEELGIYREIKAFVQRQGLGPHELVIDPTGGKKSMSASAALAGYLLGAWLVYVDYRDYHPVKRIPVAGTEYPRLMHNPLEEFGDLEKDRILMALHRGSFEEAHNLAAALADRLYDPREAQALQLAAAAYGAWQQFQFSDVREQLQKLSDHLHRFGSRGQWSWTAPVLAKLPAQQAVIHTLAEVTAKVCTGQKPASLEEGLPLVFNHLAATERALAHQRPSTAMLLIYATLERYIDLCLWVYFQLDDEKPDYARVSLDETAFHTMGKIFHGKSYRPQELGGPVTLALGAQLLATLRPDLLPKQYLGKIKGMLAKRNRCEFEHGLCPQAVTASDVKDFIALVKNILTEALKKSPTEFDQDLEPYRFPTL